MGTLNIVPSIRQMVQGTSQPGHSHIRWGHRKLQPHKSITSCLPDWVLHLSPVTISKAVGPVHIYPCGFSLSDYRIDIVFRQTHCDGSHIAGGIECQNAILVTYFSDKHFVYWYWYVSFFW
jgi:hypothetical protein